MSHTILVADDEAGNSAAVRRVLEREGHQVFEARDGQEALVLLQEHTPSLMITDLKMPKLNGLELLRAAKQLLPDLGVIVMTAYGSVETAVEAMRDGASDFISKPLHRADLVRSVRSVLEKYTLSVENRQLRKELASLSHKESWIGNAPVMRLLKNEAAQVADSLATVFLCGESGTGKGMLARWLHEGSPHAEGSFVALNCSAIPESLMESELFGHEKGAFTGALRQRKGRFEQANKGTLFLDEITEMPIHLQAKLLRVLQDGEFERVGGNHTLHAETRIIAATNRNPLEAIQQEKLREDLYYRLNVIQLQLPPLRERQADIPLLAQHFLEKHAEKHRRNTSSISEEALQLLSSWKWPGNVRELENIIERAVVLSRSEQIEPNAFPLPIREHMPTGDLLYFAVGTPLAEMERRMIQSTLQLVNGDKNRAAELLGITARTIYRKEAEWLKLDTLRRS